MIDFRNERDVQFGCQYIEEIIEKHPQSEITLRELNKILIRRTAVPCFANGGLCSTY